MPEFKTKYYYVSEKGNIIGSDSKVDGLKVVSEEDFDNQNKERLEKYEAYVNSKEQLELKAIKNQNEAFSKLLNSFTIKASYPQKQDAMEKAINDSDIKSTEAELFEKAVKFLN